MTAYEKIKEALRKIDGHKIASHPSGKSFIEIWGTRKETIVVFNYGKDGASVYVPIQDENNIDKECEAILRRG